MEIFNIMWKALHPTRAASSWSAQGGGLEESYSDKTRRPEKVIWTKHYLFKLLNTTRFMCVIDFEISEHHFMCIMDIKY